MDKREEILRKCDIVSDGLIWNGDGDIIKYDGEIQTIWNAMDENGRQMCMDLLEYMAENEYKCYCAEDDNGEPYYFFSRGCGHQNLTKEELFQNFL